VRGLLGALDDRREEGIRDIGHEHPEREGAPQPQTARQKGGPVPQARRGHAHAIARLRAEREIRPLVQDARDRRGMDVRRARDINDRGAL
jgi:hypothetical protein